MFVASPGGPVRSSFVRDTVDGGCGRDHLMPSGPELRDAFATLVWGPADGRYGVDFGGRPAAGPARKLSADRLLQRQFFSELILGFFN